jgi:hypothetical protein
MPADVQALSRLFPVMSARRVPYSTRPQREQEIPGPNCAAAPSVRSAEGVARENLEIVSRSSSTSTILQWADADSAALLEELLRQPEAPPLLLIVSFRSEDMSSKPFLKLLAGADWWRDVSRDRGRSTHGERGSRPDRVLTAGRDCGRDSRLEDIVREAAGSPFSSNNCRATH